MMFTIIITVLILVYKSFCNTVCIYDHVNKTSCYCCGFVGQSAATPSVASFSPMESSAAALNVGSPSGEISTETSSTGNTLESSSETINVVSPSGTIDVPLSYVTVQTLNAGSSTAASFTTAALHSVSHSVKPSQVTTASISTTETGVEPTIASTVKPTITSSVNGK